MNICPGTIIQASWHNFEQKNQKNTEFGENSVFVQRATENIVVQKLK